MKKIILFLLGLILSLPAMSQDFDLNFKVTQNDRTNGGTLKMMIQMRRSANGAASDFRIGNSNLRFGYNSDAVTPSSFSLVPTLDISANPPGTAWYSSTLVDNSVGTDPIKLISVNLNYNLPAAPTSGENISTSWVDLGELSFTIVDNTELMQLTMKPFDHNSGNTVVTLSNNTTNVGTDLGDKHDNVTYNGTTWFGGNGLNEQPNESDACKPLIVSSGAASVSGNAEVEFIEINGGSLTMEGGSTMRPFNQSASNYITTTSNFILNADSPGNGAQYWGPKINGTARQETPTNVAAGGQDWTNISLPATGALVHSSLPAGETGGGSFNATPDASGSWGNYVSTTTLYYFVASATNGHEWAGVTSTTNGGFGVGYNLFGGGQFSVSGALSGSGTYNPIYVHTNPHGALLGTGSQSAVVNADPAAHKANWDGWRLVGNPYTTGLDVAEFLNDNPDFSDVRVFDKNAQNVGGGNLGFVSGSYTTLTTGVIPPMQGFWVKGGVPGTSGIDYPSNVIFEEDQRTFSIGTFYKTNSVEQVELTVTYPISGAFAKVHFVLDGAASKGYDYGIDQYTLDNPGPTVPHLGIQNTYIATNGSTVVAPLQYNAVPMPVGMYDSYTLRMSSLTSGIHEFSVDNSLLGPGWRVFIEDTQYAPGTYHEITNNKFSFTYTSAVDDPTRFILHFSPLGASVNINENDGSIANWNPVAWFDNNDLVIRIEGIDAPENTELQILDMAGNLIMTTDANDGETVLPTQLASGMYIVNAISKDNSEVKYVKVMKP